MADATEPGMWVEAIMAPGIPDPRVRIAIGSIWIVREAFDFHGWPTIIIDVQSSHVTRGWLAASFRPIYKPKSELLERLKQPAPAEREPVSA